MSLEIFCLKPFAGKSNESASTKNDLLQLYTGKCLLPPTFSRFAQRILDAPVKEDDIWMVSFPRTGSTWCQEMIWLIANNLDFETAQSTIQQVRAPLLESSVVLFEQVDVTKINGLPIPRYAPMQLPLDLLPESLNEVGSKLSHLFADSPGFVNDLPSPRFIKSHLPIDLLPEKIMNVKPKIIYTMRNPKDLCVSFYFHCQILHKLDVDFEAFCELFLNDALPIGSVFDHYFGFWNRRHEEHILVIKYEDMKNDTRETVKAIAKFLEKSLTDEDVDAICEFLSFQNMRENKACNLQILVENRQGENFYEETGKHFIRKGIVGDHKNHMSPEMIKRFDRWIEENTQGTDLRF